MRFYSNSLRFGNIRKKLRIYIYIYILFDETLYRHDKIYYMGRIVRA